MITHNSDTSSSSSDDETTSSDIENMDTNTGVSEDKELTQVEFEAFPPADEDWSGVRSLLDSLCQGLTLDIGYLSQTIIDNYKVGTVVKGADIQPGEDDPVFAIASILPLKLVKDSKKLTQFTESILSKCTEDCDTAEIRRVIEAPDTALMVNAKFSNLPLQITAQLYKALKMELITERKEQDVYNVKHFIIVGKGYTSPDKSRRHKKQKTSGPVLKYQNLDLELFAEVAAHTFSWKITDETLAPVNSSAADDVMQGYRSVLIVPLDKFLKRVDKIVEELTDV